MKTTINITATSQDMDRFADCETLKRFYSEKGIDGLELMLCGEKTFPEKITSNDVLGIHLNFFPSWLDLWNDDRQALIEEYGDEKIWTEHYGGKDKNALLTKWEEELEIAHQAGVRYVVFHVSECRLDECYTYRFRHTDEEVCTAACEIINRLLDKKPYQFYFLVENLWWSGLTMTRPQIVKDMMEEIHYKNKGIMLDTGHLLHTNLDLKDQDEGVEYINHILDKNGELCSFIKGIHLNQSITGDYVKKVIQNPPTLNGNYWQRLMQTYPHIFQIDNHKPFTADKVAQLVQRISPEFLTFELITNNNAEHEQALKKQLESLKRNGGIR